MNASKEEAKIASNNVWLAASDLDALVAGFKTGEIVVDDQVQKIKRKLATVEKFLEAAERKLPTEAAFNRDRKRAKV